MATDSYDTALQAFGSLSRQEQLRLIQELEAQLGKQVEEPSSVLELCGLGEDIWGQMDAQEYVNRERSMEWIEALHGTTVGLDTAPSITTAGCLPFRV
jgi:hypothetical protein